MTREEAFFRTAEKYPGRYYASHPAPAGGIFRPRDFPSPLRVPHTFSGSLQRGHRIWAFDTAEDRDNFIREWPRAVAIEEPKP